MASEPTPKVFPAVRCWLGGVSVILVLLGGLTLIGWVLDLPLLLTVLPDFVPMKPNTALCFILIGLSLGLMPLDSLPHQVRRWLIRLTAFGVFTVALVTLGEHLFGWDAGIDQLLFSVTGPMVVSGVPGRMSSNTASAFLLLSVALMLMSVSDGGRKSSLAVAVCGALVIMLGLFSPVGSIVTDMLHFGSLRPTAMAVHTAGGLLLSGICLLILAWHRARLQWSIEKTVGFGFGVTLLVLGAMSVLACLNDYDVMICTRAVQHTRQVIETIESLLANLLNAESGHRGYLITGDQRFLEQVRAAQKKVMVDLESLRTLTVDNARQQEQIRDLEPLIARQLALFSHSIESQSAADPSSQKQKELVSGEWDLMEGIRAGITQLQQAEKLLLNQRNNRLQVEQRKGLYVVPVGNALACAAIIAALVIVWRDISKRRQTEELLQASEERYRRLFETAQDGILILDTDTGRVIDANPFMTCLLDYSREELLGKLFWEIGRFDDVGAIQGSFEELRREGHIRYDNLPLLTRQDRQIEVEVVCNLCKTNQREVVQCHIQDITDRKRSAEALAQERNLLRTLIDQLPDYIFVKDTQRRFRAANIGVARIMGAATPADLLGKRDEDFYPAEQAAVYRADEERLLSSGEPVINKDEPHTDSDGHQRAVLTTKLPFRNQQGQIIGLVGVSRDITDWRLAVDELRVSRERFRLATEGGELGTWDWDLVRDELIWDERCRALFGLSPEAPVSYKAFLEAIYVEDRARVEESVALARSEKKEYATDFRVLWRDGGIHWIHSKGRGICDESGRMVRMVGVAIDISRRKQIEEALRVNEQLARHRLAELQVIYSQAPAGLAFINPDLRFIKINERMAEINRRSVSDHLGRTVREVMPELADPLEEAFQKVLQNDEPVLNLEIQNSPREPGAREQWWLVSCYPVQAPDLDGVSIIMLDITERKRSEAQLRLQAVAMESAVNAIVITDRTGKIQWINDAFTQLTGYTMAEATGQNLRVLKSGVHDEAFYRQMWGTILGGHPWRGELVNRRKDGHFYHEEMTITPVTDTEGGITHFVVIKQDISERKKAEGELRAARERLNRYAEDLQKEVNCRTSELQATVSDLESFSYSLSHDMRAPLRAIQSYTEMVLEDEKLNSSGAAFLEKVVQASRRLDQLIQDVLTVSRFSQKNIELQTVDLERLIMDLIHERREWQPPRVLIEIRRPLLAVRGHEASLTQCFTNLLDNAVKFVASDVIPQIVIWSEPAGDQVRLWIEDNGIGINRSDQERIFQIFSRAHADGLYKGTGVGLAIVRKAVERMGGRVGVESEPGHGSRFWLLLPKAEVL